MNRNRLFTNLNKLCLELDNRYNINCGGCCYVAACIAEQLELYNISFKIIHYDIYHCHYAIKVSDRYINRDYHTKKEIYEILDWNSNKLFERYYNEGWNFCYKTKHNNVVRNEIQKLFLNENRRTRLHNGTVVSRKSKI